MKCGNHRDHKITDHKNDFYPTPDYVTKALMDREEFHGSILEPAAGAGDMVKVIQNYNKNVIATDLIDRGNPEIESGIDFLQYEKSVDHIITNPPFDLATEFLIKAKQIARKKIALLQRIQFLESKSRYPIFQDREFPLKKVYVFSERVKMSLAGRDCKGGSQMTFCWYIWDRDYQGDPVISWITPKGFK
jgi:hypothetical protein